MANDAYTQTALSRDLNFQQRVRANVMSVAWTVLDEDVSTEFHSQRASFARLVVNNPDGYVQTVSAWVVMRPGVFNFETTYNFPANAFISATGDPDISGQLLADWNDLAGVITTVPPPV